MLRHRVERVRDGLGRRGLTDLHGQRVLEHLAGQLLDVVGHGGREQQGLALLRDGAHDAAHVGQEAHVKHAVRLVEHQHFDPAQVDGSLADMIEQATRAGNDDLDAALEAPGPGCVMPTPP